MQRIKLAFCSVHTFTGLTHSLSRAHWKPCSPRSSFGLTAFRSAIRRVVTMTSTAKVTEQDATSGSTQFKLALCQIPVIDDKEKNLATAREYLLRAHQGGAQLAVLPECFNCPYGTQFFREYAEKVPSLDRNPEEPHDSKSLAMLQDTARETGMYIVGGSIPEMSTDGNVYNCSLTVSPNGMLVAKHRKAHLFDIDVPGGIRFKESEVLSAGSSATAFSAKELNCNIGVGICYDVRFPELAMVQARDLGAKVLIYPGAFNMTTGPAHWELLLRARALDNQVFMAACSPSRNEHGDGYKAWGHSMVVDPWGAVIGSTAEKPDVVFADIDLARLDGVRTSIPTSKQRRTDIYELQFIQK